MRDDTTPDLISALDAPTIKTYWAARLDFASETVFVWTGEGAIQPTGSGDDLLDNNVFDPLANGVVINVGDNSFSYSGSEQLDIVLGVPPSLSTEISAANAIPAEYQGRPATIWRAILLPSADPLAQPIWIWRRIRSGEMDTVEFSSDAQTINFKLTIESHASLISSASGMTYLNQKKLDPNDTSQDSSVSIANGGGPLKPSTASTGFDYSQIRNDISWL